METEYLRSGRFIHDELATRCLNVIRQIHELWKEYRQVYPTLLLWPMDGVKATTKERFSGVVFTELPDDPPLRRAKIVEAAKQCNAYGLLLTEQLEHEVRVILETPHGTRTWRIPIKNHGDVQVLGTPIVRDNTESIGIRWGAN